MPVDSVHCSVCNRTFSSYESFNNHKPCKGPKVLGASGDSIGTASVKETVKSGDGSNKPSS